MAQHAEQTYWHPRSLTGLRVIVTGAARGVGRGITAALLERGAAVLMVDRNPGVADVAADFAADGRAVPLAADLRDRSSYQRIVDEAVQALGGIDALINNAIATNEPKPFPDITVDDFDLVFDTGPRATFFLMQAAYPLLKAAGGGSIVNLGSGSGTGGQTQWGAYAAAKEAIRGMSKVAALEWGIDNIRVNVVCPFANSDGVAGWSEAFPDVYNKVVKSVPLRRVGDTHSDIGAMVAYLVSPDASYMTAQTIHVDGGTGTFR
ncbi:SDR family NAD(P)-dependent oxidoreductase [Mycobacterium sp. CVI_P3]|uniref:SDR family NAD(P)-dependent oxidoreductase n=1 Tax=Mycobacterium pinniadriaticum TaxID=2994102 RepID=A0ABT3SPR8_9MYCO|nr:SDR family NAD(P)-dependent oxidoreductase [Mycobacterium pinniadriaticum]MCX2934933.1 SDR family NAD(P)-dependent oxidoreductase [Mycobacterium pinniadriaticum]MCX2941352.1 SDR family NAD(P)-dependent oxidoreductase [Mycobacterium pinniadriaticum]